MKPRSKSALTALLLSFGLGSCASMGFGSRTTSYSPRDYVPSYEVRSADVRMGMAMRDVLSSWGEPHSIQSAGDPGRGNQRWIYPNSSAAHLTRRSSRIIYFENGRVAGWETVPTWHTYQ